ncbi:MAG: hypothetical protein GX875_09645, partial [Propionibacterium sp.]|nr:hypothetical protein [Propionibacterium sp.]
VRRLSQWDGLDASATANLVQYVRDELAATGAVPDAGTIVIERFRDEIGDWRVCVLSSLGRAVLSPLSMLLRHTLRERYGVEPQVMCTNDGIVLRIPDADGQPPDVEILTSIDLTRVQQIVEDEVGASALFSARFRECAARALLLPKRNPGKRSPLWQQRQRATQLLQVAREYPDFPITLETMRECLHDVFDLPGLMDLLRAIAARRIRVVAVEAEQASPFAQQLLFGLVGTFIYDEDQPVAERRLAALSLDPAMLDELLGGGSEDELLDPAVADELLAEGQRLAPGWQAEDAEQLWDLLRQIGPLTEDEIVERCTPGDSALTWLAELAAQERIQRVSFGPRSQIAQLTGLTEPPVPLASRSSARPREYPAKSADVDSKHPSMWVVSDDLDWLYRGHDTQTPTVAQLTPTAVERLCTRWTRHHVVVWPNQLSQRFGIDEPTVLAAFDRLCAAGELARYGRATSGEASGFIHRRVLESLKVRTLARLRRSVQPVSQADFARFLTSWHELDAPQSGIGALSAAIDQLAG